MCLLACVAAGAAAGEHARKLDSRIPKTDHERFAEVWKTEWRNPRIMVDRDGAYLLLDGNAFDASAQRYQSADALADALVALPVSSWPYGRIVSLTQTPRVQGGIRGQLVVTDPGFVPLDKVRRAVEALDVEVIESPVGCGCGS